MGLRPPGGAQAPRESIRVTEPNVSIAALIERYPGSWEARNTTKSRHTTNGTQELNWDGKTRRVAASACARNRSKLNRTQDLYRVSWEEVEL